jgi:hypothetical protein
MLSHPMFLLRIWQPVRETGLNDGPLPAPSGQRAALPFLWQPDFQDAVLTFECGLVKFDSDREADGPLEVAQFDFKLVDAADVAVLRQAAPALDGNAVFFRGYGDGADIDTGGIHEDDDLCRGLVNIHRRLPAAARSNGYHAGERTGAQHPAHLSLQFPELLQYLPVKVIHHRHLLPVQRHPAPPDFFAKAGKKNPAAPVILVCAFFHFTELMEEKSSTKQFLSGPHLFPRENSFFFAFQTGHSSV